MEGGWCRAMTRTRLLAAPEPARSQAATWPIHGCCEPQAQTLVPALHLPLQQVPQLVTLAPAREHREVQPGRRQPGWQAVQRLAARQAAQLAPHAAHDAPELVDRQYWPAGQGAAQVQLLQLGPARCGAHVRHVLPSRHVAHLAGQALHVAALPVTRHHWPAPHEGKQ